MNNWLGSHWRWRVAMLAVVAGILGYASWQAGRWKARELVESGGSPAIYRVVYRDRSQSIEAFDWKRGKCWTICPKESVNFGDDFSSSMRVSGDGATLVWRQGLRLHLVKVQPPHERRTITTPMHRALGSLIGLSHDARFAVFQTLGERVTLPDGKVTVVPQTNWVTKGEGVAVLSVVDTESGEVVSTREWKSYMSELNQKGEFESYFMEGEARDESEPAKGRWKFSAHGEWELIETVSIAEELKKPRRPPDGSPAARWLLAAWADTRGRLPVDDEQAMILEDVRDDITVLDLTTGKVIAKEAAGSRRRNHLMAAGIALLLLALAFTWNALFESRPAWALFDALVAGLLIQGAVLPIYTSYDYYDFRSNLSIDVSGLVLPFFFRGYLTGSAILAGWYWAHGREWFGLRWLLGTLWIIASAVPLAINDSEGLSRDDWPMILRAGIVCGLLIAASTGLITASIRLVGWSIRDASYHRTPLRFGLASLFVVIPSAAITIVLIQSLWNYPRTLDLPHWSLASLIVGIPIVGAFFLRSRWMGALAFVALLLLSIAGSYVCIETLGRLLLIPRSQRYVGEAVALVSSAVAILVPCFVLRGHGYRWVRVLPAERDSEVTA